KAALDALKWDFFVPNNQIKVVVTSGFITISGTVQKYYKKLSEEKAVQNLIGVIGVNNEITVLPDAQAKNIKERIIEEFNRNAKIDENSVNVEVEGGIVTLKGQVRDFDEDKEARLVAWSVPGVSKVIDQMLISWR
ncbi:MAG: BON domain-containing protein, partial [Pseudomonadota bacterium]